MVPCSQETQSAVDPHICLIQRIQLLLIESQSCDQLSDIMADQLTGHNRRNSRVSPFGLSLSITLSFTSHAEVQPRISSHNQSCNSFVLVTTGLGQTSSNIMRWGMRQHFDKCDIGFHPKLVQAWPGGMDAVGSVGINPRTSGY